MRGHFLTTMCWQRRLDPTIRGTWTSPLLGVHERPSRLQPRQLGIFQPPQNLADAMVHALRGALSDLLAEDRIYISLSSDRLDNAFDYRGLTAGE